MQAAPTSGGATPAQSETLPELPVTRAARAKNPRTRSGTSVPSSTRCSSGVLPTPTATAPATCRASSEKLDYLKWLGVDCIWLLPIYQSPLRDGGYDISDFTSVLPEFGDLGDFVTLVDEAHKPRHAHHRRPRHEPHVGPAPVVPGVALRPRGPLRRLLRLGETTTSRYPDARIIFIDTERSNWTWDETRKQYYWHRFFSHQPDLNYESPRRTGRDDRGPEVLARHGHRRVPPRCRSLPVRPRRHQRREPARRRTTSSNGYAARSTPSTPTACCSPRQTSGRATSSNTWATPANRRRRMPHGVPLPGDAAHLHGRAPRVPLPDLRGAGADAADPGELPVGHLPAQPRRADARDGDRRGARLHVFRIRQGRSADEGQRRDPAPAGSRCWRTPAPRSSSSPDCCSRSPAPRCMYYGDEIGMGDNIYLGDRDGVRTPMQWSVDRNAGFSKCRPGAALPAGHHGPGLRLPGRSTSRPSSGAPPHCFPGPAA